jgi:hypothetical protein
VVLAPPEYEEEVLSIYQDLPLEEKGTAVGDREEG